jgi:hypothetical protein
MFALVSVLFGAFTVFAVLDGQIAASFATATVSLLFALGVWRSLAAELYADSDWAGCTNPWPKRGRRDDFAEIRYAGPFISPCWEFVRRDGRVAFRVSPFMYGGVAIRRMTEFLGLRFPGSYRGV